MKLYADVDGCCADIIKALGYLPREVTKYDFSNLDPDEQGRVWRNFGEPRFWLDLPVIHGALAALEVLERSGHTIIFCTSPFLQDGLAWTKCRKEWLIKKGFLTAKRGFVVTSDKHMLLDEHSILIDDRKETCLKCVPTPILFGTAAYSEVTVEEASKVILCKDWESVVDTINEISGAWLT
jgi:5'(3')-deoxyribonucleotidase